MEGVGKRVRGEKISEKNGVFGKIQKRSKLVIIKYQ